MENLAVPYSIEQIEKPDVQRNLEFINSLEISVQNMGVFNHPLLLEMANGKYEDKFVLYVLSQFSKHIRVFTAELSHLLGIAPDIRSRFMLFDNLYEEMGRGKLENCHYNLYMKMLNSLGVSDLYIKKLPALYSIELLNDGLSKVISSGDFASSLAWLGLGGELTIPNNFPLLEKSLKTFQANNSDAFSFFERHGDRDQMHSDDANLLLAMHISEADYQRIELEVGKSLKAREYVWDELLNSYEKGIWK